MQGIILLDKPAGITSFKAVSSLRRITGERRIGHTGTLDPMATGVLPVLIGRATALSSFLLESDKKYTAVIKTGISTDTCDITGKTVFESDKKVLQSDIEDALRHFTGEIDQVPPAFSAIRQNGVHLYELARRGIETDIPQRSVTVYSAELVKQLSRDEFEVNFSVSKGTYIRALARDIGEYLGCYAVLSSLRRTEVSGFSLDECTPLDRIDSHSVRSLLRNEERAVMHLREVYVSEKQAVRFSNGGHLDYDRLRIHSFENGELFRVKCGNAFLGIAVADNQNSRLAVKCVINVYK